MDGRTNRRTESHESVFTRSSVFPDHLECISDVLKECVTDGPIDGPINGPTDGPTDRPTDGWTDRPMDRQTDRRMDGQSLIQRCEDAFKNPILSSTLNGTKCTFYGMSSTFYGTKLRFWDIRYHLSTIMNVKIFYRDSRCWTGQKLNAFTTS